MIYRRNLGSKEQWARFLGGALIALCSLTQLGATPLLFSAAQAGDLLRGKARKPSRMPESSGPTKFTVKPK